MGGLPKLGLYGALLLSTVSASALLAPGRARADAPQASGPGAGAQVPVETAGSQVPSRALEEIVVTAERREQSLQIVPVAVTSVNGKALEDTSFQSLTDLQFVVPGVQYDPTQGSAFQIRGVGSESFDFSNEKSVSVVVDDVVMDAQRDNGLTGLEDISRVDVLMGPQGTLFGKNSTSGVISVTTNDPKLDVWAARGYVAYGERDDRIVNLMANVPLGPTAALRVTAFDQGQDGYGEYTTLHTQLGAFSEYGYRAKLLFRPFERLTVIFANDFEHHYDTSIRTAVGGSTAAVTADEIALGVTPGPENANDADGSKGSIRTFEFGDSLHVKYLLGDDTLTSITAYRGTRYVNDTPADLLPGNVYAYIPYNDGDLHTSKFSEEFHWASPTGRFVEYLGGVFYNKLIADQTQLQWYTGGAPLVSSAGTPLTHFYTLTGAYNPATGALLGNDALFAARNTTEAAFGQLKFNLTKAFDIAFSGRYSYDDNSQSLSFFNVPSAPFTGTNDTFTATSAAPLYPEGALKGNNFSYKIAPEYRLTDAVMLYAVYSTGYKPAGVAFVGNKYDPYKAETVTSYEVGEKSEFFDHRVRLNFDVFDEEFRNFQATVLTAIPGQVALAAVIGNAGGLKSEGFETNLAWRVTDSFTLNGSATYADAYFTNYIANATTNDTNTDLTNAPRWSVFASANYERQIFSQGLLKANIDYSFRSKVYTVTGMPAYSLVPGFSLVNGKISYSPKSGQLEIGLYARNLLNTYFSTGWQEYGTLGLLHYTSPDAYRTVGAFLRFSY